MSETAEQIAARYGAVCRPGLRVTVCPPYATTEAAWEPVKPQDVCNRQVRLRSLGARLRAADRRAEPEPIEQMVMVSGPVRKPTAKPGPKPKERRKRTIEEQRALQSEGAKRGQEASKAKRNAIRDGHEQELRRLCEQGLSDSEIARALGANRSTIQLWRSHFGIASSAGAVPFAAMLDTHAETIRQMFAGGLTDRDIAHALGVSRFQVCRMRKAMGLPAAARRKKNAFCGNGFDAKIERAENARQRGPGPERNATCNGGSQ